MAAQPLEFKPEAFVLKFLILFCVESKDKRLSASVRVSLHLSEQLQVQHFLVEVAAVEPHVENSLIEQLQLLHGEFLREQLKSHRLKDFSGVNMPKHNLFGALVGLAVTIPTLYLLIPPLGMVGAGISASLTHLATIIYQWIVFKKNTGVSNKELLITKDDMVMLKDAVLSIFRR